MLLSKIATDYKKVLRQATEKLPKDKIGTKGKAIKLPPLDSTSVTKMSDQEVINLMSDISVHVSDLGDCTKTGKGNNIFIAVLLGLGLIFVIWLLFLSD